MAYDPDLPANRSPIVSAELREQFQALKGMIDERPDGAEVHSRIIEASAGNVNRLENLQLTVSHPPTQAQVQAVVDKVNELLAALKRQ